MPLLSSASSAALPGKPAAWLLVAVLAGGVLAGCATVESVSGPPTSPAERRAALEAVGTWEARGRIALKTPDASGQGNFIWTQDGARTVLRVAGPFGAEAREIRWEPGRLTVLSGGGEVAADYAGADAAQRFLDAQLGWSLPVANARYWLLGLAGPDSGATESLDDAGLLVGLTQDGWEVRYEEYRPEVPASLPRKVLLESAGRRIRLVIDRWQF